MKTTKKIDKKKTYTVFKESLDLHEILYGGEFLCFELSFKFNEDP